jgi:hypothetical protein
VSWRVFSATISILLIIFAACLGWLIQVDAGHDGELKGMQPQFAAIQTQLAQVQTDLQWIKASLAEKK